MPYIATFRIVVIATLISVGNAMQLTTIADTPAENPSERYTDAYKAYTNATCPIAADDISHFVYFARNRKGIYNHALLTHERFDGAQIMYSWRALEPAQDRYDFSSIRADIEYLLSHEKRLFIQLQDVSFSAEYVPVPDYLLEPAYDGGVVPEYMDTEIVGWAAKRWNPAVQDRFSKLLIALGAEFDGQIEGINLQESAIEANSEVDLSFSPALYAEALKTNMRSLKDAFPNSTTMQYANFMPGEWLPWEDKGYLRGLYQTGEEIGVGLGAPDLMYKRKSQLNHALAMMHEHTYSVPIGIAIQDGNYIGATGADYTGNPDAEELLEEHKKAANSQSSIVPVLHAFAKDFLKVDYMFWVDEEPYFEEDVIACFTASSTLID